MAADGDVFVDVIVDTKNSTGLKTLNKRLDNTENVIGRSSQAVKKNNEWWTRNIIRIKVAQKEYTKLNSIINKIARTTKTVTGVGFKDAAGFHGFDEKKQQQAKNQEAINKWYSNFRQSNAAFWQKQDAANKKIEERNLKSLGILGQPTAVQKSVLRKQNKNQQRVSNPKEQLAAAWAGFGFFENANMGEYSKTLEKANAKSAKEAQAVATWYSNLRIATDKLTEKMQRIGISKRDAYTNAEISTKKKSEPISQGAMGVLTNGLPPEVAESYHATWRESKRLFGQADHMKRWAASAHKVSMAMLAANMSALGLYFSMFSGINLIKQGLTGLFTPLSDVGSMFESLAMSEAFGSGVEYDADQMVEAWERFTGLKSDIAATIAVLGAKVLTDPEVWDAISTGVKAFMDELSKPETIDAIKSMVIALADALPAIAKEIPDIANFVKSIAPWLTMLIPLALKAAIVMPFLSLATGVASFATAMLGGITAILRFRAAYKSLGLLKALGTLATGTAEGVAIETAGGAAAGAAGGAAGGLLSKITTKLPSAWTLIKTAFITFFSTTLPEALSGILATTAGTIVAGLVGGLAVGIAAINILNATGVLQWVSDITDGFRDAFIKGWTILSSDTGIIGTLANFGATVGNIIGDALNFVLSPTGNFYLTNSKMNEFLNSGVYNSGVLDKLQATYGNGVSYYNGGYYLDGQKITNYTTNTYTINVQGNMTKDTNDDLMNKLYNHATYG